MGDSSPLSYEHLRDVLLVTTPEASEKFDALNPTGIPENSLAHVQGVMGDRLFWLPSGITDVHDAATLVRERIQNRHPDEAEINAVVLIGDYEALPSQTITTYTFDYLLHENPDAPKEHGDTDLWQVWTDDPYGDTNSDRLAEIPVSRIPVPPVVGGILGDAPPFTTMRPRVFGVRSDDCPFADDIFGRFLLDDPARTMKISPPAAADGTTAEDDLEDADVSAERLYLVLHGDPVAGTGFSGRKGGRDPESAAAVDFDVAGGMSPSRGVVFAAVCWGGLTSRAAVMDSDPIAARTAENSIVLALLNRGVNAVVGFTGVHYVEKDDPVRRRGEAQFSPHLFGSPLHHLFWKNITERGLQPSEALFQARQSYIRNPALATGDKMEKLIAVKTYWSATCLGLGRLPGREP